MVLDIGSLMFNMDLNSGGTPSWGTDMGQGEGYKFNFENTEELITSLAYTCVDDIENVKCEFGKGGSRTDDYKIVLASLYSKVFVNDELIPDAEFLIVVAKQVSNPSGYHIGRRTLKYSPNMTYKDFKVNEKCFEIIKNKLGLNNNSAWFVSEMKTKNQDELHLTIYVADKDKALIFENAHDRKEFVKQLMALNENGNIQLRAKGGYNKIYYGVPGTGKSYTIAEKLKDVKQENKFRITFHPEYTYNDFIGQLLPTIVKEGEHKGDITYDFQKGPFTRALEKAYNTPEEAIYLIIEEMSRGNCAAIFGDIFQLLDRKKSGDDKDWSIYPVYNEIIAKDIKQIPDGRIKIPSNLYILGTVNTSDQNVYVMDNAFKRRFEWEYMSTKPVPKNGPYKNNVELKFYNGTEMVCINWIDLYGVLNKFISSSEKLGLGEDKQIGQFFIEFDGIEAKDEEKIKNKLLHYLWFDIQQATYKTEIKLFDDTITSFSELYDKYDTKGKVFSNQFFECIDAWKNNNL